MMLLLLLLHMINESDRVLGATSSGEASMPGMSLSGADFSFLGILGLVGGLVLMVICRMTIMSAVNACSDKMCVCCGCRAPGKGGGKGGGKGSGGGKGGGGKGGDGGLLVEVFLNSPSPENLLGFVKLTELTPIETAVVDVAKNLLSHPDMPTPPEQLDVYACRWPPTSPPLLVPLTPSPERQQAQVRGPVPKLLLKLAGSLCSEPVVEKLSATFKWCCMEPPPPNTSAATIFAAATGRVMVVRSHEGEDLAMPPAAAVMPFSTVGKGSFEGDEAISGSRRGRGGGRGGGRGLSGHSRARTSDAAARVGLLEEMELQRAPE